MDAGVFEFRLIVVLLVEICARNFLWVPVRANILLALPEVSRDLYNDRPHSTAVECTEGTKEQVVDCLVHLWPP